MKNILDKLRGFFPADPDEAPVAAEERVPWVKVGLLVRNLSLPHLKAVFFTVPVIVFFTISGVFAWLALLVKFLVGIYNLF